MHGGLYSNFIRLAAPQSPFERADARERTKKAEEQRAAVEHQHERMFSLDRGLYCALMTLPGTTDFNRQLAIKKLLHQPRRPHHQALLSDAEELNILRWLVQTLPPTRMLKMFVMLKESRVNNARTRKLMLRSLLSHPRLELWCTRYRKKLRIVLEHALGQRMSGIVRSITKKAPSSWNDKEQNILHKHIGKHGHASQQKKVYECVSFILGNEEHLCLPLLKAYKAAKHDLEEGKRLPYETLEGIRSTYHKEIPTTQVLSLTKGQLTEGQKIGMQRAAEKAGVEVTFDPNKQSALRLYIYSFERGMDESIKQALQKKATQAAQNLPTRWKHAGLLVDASASMMGDSTQALRPMSVALATRDMLRAASETSSVLYCGGRHEEETGLTYPCGGTSLAEGLIQLLRDTPDVVFILSDGYENSPAGRLAEVIKQIRKLGINTPIYQFSPVFGAESGGLRCLAKDLIPALPVTSPQDMGLPLLKGMLQNEPVKALQGLLTLTTKLLSGQVHKQMTAKPPHTPLNAKVA